MLQYRDQAGHDHTCGHLGGGDHGGWARLTKPKDSLPGFPLAQSRSTTLSMELWTCKWPL
jgi:hypothetical protein